LQIHGIDSEQRRASAMSSGQKFAVAVIGLSLAAVGILLMLEELNWKSMLGLTLILWGNNMSQSRTE
jgi:hypothetical protein